MIPDCIQQKAKMFQRHYAGNLRVTCLELNFRLSRRVLCVLGSWDRIFASFGPLVAA